MKSRLAAACAALALSATVPAVQADTVDFAGWTWGYHNVNATTPISTSPYQGVVGGFNVKLSDSSNSVLDEKSFQAYCVEMTETISVSGSYGNYGVMDASSYFIGANASKATTLGRLISYVFDTNLFGNTTSDRRDELSTALQLAIWNTVYDTDTTLDSGPFSDSSAYRSNTGDYLGANQLLANSASHAISYDLYVLYSGRPVTDVTGGHQDQLIWLQKPPQQANVPEPGSLALTFAALAGLGFAARRRSTKT